MPSSLATFPPEFPSPEHHPAKPQSTSYLRPLADDIDKSPEALASTLHIRHSLNAYANPAISRLAMDKQDHVRAFDILKALDFYLFATTVDARSVGKIDI